MGWGEVRSGAGRYRAGAEVNVNVAAAAGAAQLPAVFLLWWAHALATDPYGVGYGGAFGLACLAVLAPAYLPLLGLLHACAQTVPGALLGGPAFRRLPWPRWVRQLVGAGIVGLLWAAVGAVLWGWPYVTAALVLVGLGVLPVLAVAYARVRAVGSLWGIWWRAGVASVALFVFAFVGSLLASVTGLVEEYEAPELSAAELAGVWRGDDGEVLELRPGGRATLTGMPVRAGFEAEADFEVCAGGGTWSLRGESEYGTRDAVAVRLETGSGTGSGCGEETLWTLAGTEADPELFVIFGDPDAGEVRVLTRDS
ncbi:hypothetical protein [Streptomyces sp. A012304]|uniref:hypothetical protein n=1 Tax=Streptomyces sp. A012304 TaxID=375446 RepID=UPI0022320D0A|nr:hypothetical protein [Streptomyces sp. A012304]